MHFFEDIVLDAPQESAPLTISQEQIIAFGKEYDPQPFHIDVEEAKKWPTGLIASSLHTYALSMKMIHGMMQEPVAAIAGLGVDNMRMFAPVRPDDQLRVKTWVSQKRLSKSNPSRGITTTTIEVFNQLDEVVMSYQNSGLIMCRPLETATSPAADALQ